MIVKSRSEVQNHLVTVSFVVKCNSRPIANTQDSNMRESRGHYSFPGVL